MATFNPNPDDRLEPWIEKSAINGMGFRVWHLILFCFSALAIIVTVICCCLKIRIPRTKQEIEADYQRKKITAKFREKLRLIHNQEMDAMDLKREIIQEDLRTEHKTIERQFSTGSIVLQREKKCTMEAEPQQPFSKLAKLIKCGKVHQEALEV